MSCDRLNRSEMGWYALIRANMICYRLNRSEMGWYALIRANMSCYRLKRSERRRGRLGFVSYPIL